MRVLAGARLDLAADPPAAAVCRALAGEEGRVISLADLGLKNPYRSLTPAEVHLLRGALKGEGDAIGYVCRGTYLAGHDIAATATRRCVAVTDHVNLTWRSPLIGPNDDYVGPRFPSLIGVYAPHEVLALGQGVLAPGDRQEGMIIVAGVVAGVPDDRALSGYVIDRAARLGWVAVSSELVAPVLVAAHMGLRVAAAVLTG